MKLIISLVRRLIARLAVLLVVACAFIASEAISRNAASQSQTEDRITKKIKTTNASIDDLNIQLRKKESEQKRLGSEIGSRTRRINTIDAALEKSRKQKKLRKKLSPAQVSKYNVEKARLNIERIPLLFQYTDVMFRITDITKDIGKKNGQLAGLNLQLTLAQQTNIIDYILQRNSPTDLLKSHHWNILFALFYALFFGRLTIKLINYYLFAPLAKQVGAITINPPQEMQTGNIAYGVAHKEINLDINSDQSLIVRPGWYSLNTDGVTKSRLFWDWSNPFASYAMGLVNLTEFIPGGTQARNVKIASEEDPNHDILPVHLDKHPGYVVKHGHVVATSGKELLIKKQWRLLDWRCWLFGNLRYVYFAGSGTIYIHGYGSVSTNDMSDNSRIKEQHVIGLDTRIPFSMIRTETFINYWLNQKPLYDIHFPQHGRFLQQQAFGQGDTKILRSFLEDILGATGKLLGF